MPYLNIGVIILGVISIALALGETRDDLAFHVKRTITSLSTLLAILALTNLLYLSYGSETISILRVYLRLAILAFWFLLIYFAVYGEVKAKARRREKELEALNDVALAVGKSMDLRQILNNALLSVVKIGNFGVGFIYLLNEEKNVLELAASYGHIPDNLQERLSVLQLGQEV